MTAYACEERPLNRTPLPQIRATTYKRRDSWWTVLLVDPLAVRLVWLVEPYRWITPNRLSVAALVLGLGSAACFATADRAWLAVGALLFHLSFVVDCMDGKIARLNGTGSIFGAWLDYLLDRVRVVVCAIALFGALYVETRNVWFLVLGAAMAFLDAVHHVNALEMARLRVVMRQQLDGAAARLAQARQQLRGPGTPSAVPAPATPGEPGADDPDASEAVPDPKPDFRFSFKPYVRVRDTLVAGRIRSNLVSTIELHMAVFIVAPLTGAYFTVCIGAGGLLLMFDIARSYSFYLNTKRFARRLSVADRQAEAAEAELAARDADAGAEPAGMAHAH